VTYIGSSNSQIKKIEFYNFDNELFKIIEVKSVQPGENGTYIIKDMTVKNIINGRSSEIRFTNIAINARIDDSAFNLQNLEK
jgi:translation elongation factor P/translation initiation factor 5A